MSSIRYTHPMMNLHQQLNRMFDQFDTDLFGRLEELGDGLYAPAVDVKEDPDAYTVHLEVPGVKQDNLNLSLQDNVLTIKGIKEQGAQHEGRYRRIERSYGSFVRSLSLPRSVDGAGVTANLQDGILEVRLPKREEARPRQISVTTTVNAQQIRAQSNESADENKPLQGEKAQPNSPQVSEPKGDAQAANESTAGANSDDAPEGHPS
ncbi:MAG TPA: Hsp20/alpha crystallin family protein [Abditibacteriaceae bacterium]|jgi:HSP20 family protein